MALRAGIVLFASRASSGLILLRSWYLWLGTGPSPAGKLWAGAAEKKHGDPSPRDWIAVMKD